MKDDFAWLPISEISTYIFRPTLRLLVECLIVFLNRIKCFACRLGFS